MHKIRAASYVGRTASGSRETNRLIIKRRSQISYNEVTNLNIPVHVSLDIKTFQLSKEENFAGLVNLFSSKLNLILFAIPFGIMSHYFNWGYTATFFINFISLIPLAALLSNVTEELALHTGDLIGGLISATFGNAIEMIIIIKTLRANLISVVQGALLGSILSNLLLVLGLSFFCGGLFYHVQKFNAQGAACSTSLLLLASMGIIFPTVTQITNPSIEPESLLKISRLTAFLIAVTYALFLFFQLGTHFNLFKDAALNALSEPLVSQDKEYFVEEKFLVEPRPTINCATSIFLLMIITLLVSFTSEYLVTSIEGVSESTGISKSFIGVVLLPVVSNAAEHVTAITVAIKNKPDLTMAVAIGSSIQIAMFMVPFAVLAGWAMSVPLTLVFSTVSVTALTFSVLIVIGIVQDGESNWLEGTMLIVAYLIITIIFWFEN